MSVSPKNVLNKNKNLNKRVDIDKIRLGTMKKMAKLLDTTVQALFFDEEE